MPRDVTRGSVLRGIVWRGLDPKRSCPLYFPSPSNPYPLHTYHLEPYIGSTCSHSFYLESSTGVSRQGILFPFYRWEKLRPREGKWLAQGHIASQLSDTTHDFNLDALTSRPLSFVFICPRSCGLPSWDSASPSVIPHPPTVLMVCWILVAPLLIAYLAYGLLWGQVSHLAHSPLNHQGSAQRDLQ